MDDRRLMARMASALSAVVIGLAAAWSALLALFSTSLLRRPDAERALYEEPLPYPGTWGDVALGAVSFACLASVALGLSVLTLALGGLAVQGRAPARLARHRRKLQSLALVSVGSVVLLPFIWLLAARF